MRTDSVTYATSAPGKFTWTQRAVLGTCTAYCLLGLTGIVVLLTDTQLQSRTSEVGWSRYPAHLRAALWIQRYSDMSWFGAIALSHGIGAIGAWGALRTKWRYTRWLSLYVLLASLLLLVRVGAFAICVSESPILLHNRMYPSFVTYTVNSGALFEIAGWNASLILVVVASLAGAYRGQTRKRTRKRDRSI